jgi:hypothetical protein
LSPSLYKRCPLIGLAYLAANLKDKGHEVKIIDINAEYNWPHNDNEQKWIDKEFLEGFISENSILIESLVEKILACGSQVIGFSLWATTRYVSLVLAKAIKQKDNDKITSRL